MLSLSAAVLAAATAIPPNVLFVVVDDLGFDDMGYRALEPEIKTPTGDYYAKNGVILNQYYVQPSCSPTRTTFMSGRYPLHTGINNAIPKGSNYGLSLNETTMADMLKAGGYKTHAIGKWHLGMYSYKLTPTFRGFDTFLGFYGGGEDYYTHMAGPGFDMRNDTTPNCGKNCSIIMKNSKGKYSTIMFSKEAVRKVEAHDTSYPFFMYLAYQAVHAPDEAPERYVEPYKHLPGKRATYAGMLACMDEGLGNVTKAMEAKGMMDNTIFIFSADNGGPTETCAVTGSSNWPLRGSKCSIWEGGTRGSSFLWLGPKVGATLNSVGGNYTNMMHAADWMPTISEAVGVECEKCLKWDGVSQWKALTTSNTTSPRDHIYYGVTDHQVGIHGPAMRVGCKKLILGSGGKPGGWHPPAEMNDVEETFFDLTDVDGGLRNGPLPSNPNNTMLLFDVCDDPDEHTPLNHTDDNMKIIQAINTRILDLWATGCIGCPNASCEGQAPAGCEDSGPLTIDGMPVWEPWCE